MFGLFKKQDKGVAAGQIAVPKKVEIEFAGRTHNIQAGPFDPSHMDYSSIDEGKVNFLFGNVPLMMPEIEAEVREYTSANYEQFIEEFYGGMEDFAEDVVEILEDGQTPANYEAMRKDKIIDQAMANMEPTGLYYTQESTAVMLICANPEGPLGGFKVTVNADRCIQVEYDIV